MRDVSLSSIAAVSLGGLIGAVSRYLIGTWAGTLWGAAFPWGTLLINVAGSLILGFYLTLAVERPPHRPLVRLLVTIGFCGAFTTFSTFTYETVWLWQRGAWPVAAGYVVASLVLGLLAVVIGMAAARAL